MEGHNKFGGTCLRYVNNACRETLSVKIGLLDFMGVKLPGGRLQAVTIGNVNLCRKREIKRILGVETRS